MKVIILEAVQNFGGARRSTLELAETLQNSGRYTIKVVDFWGACVPFLDEVSKRKLDFEVLESRQEPILISELSYKNKIKHWFDLITKYKDRFETICSSFKPDLVIVNNTKCLSILKSKKYKIAFFARGWFLPRDLNPRDRFLHKSKVNFYLTVSQATRQAVYATFNKNYEDIFVISNRIKLQDIRKKSNFLSWDLTSNRPFTIAHCGGFLPSKGQMIALRLAQKLKEKSMNFKLTLIGLIYKGEESKLFYNQLLKEIDVLGLQNYVEVVVNQQHVQQYFETIDVLIHPSSSEGLPRVIMEAMAFEKPVIANPVGGVTDLITHGYNGYFTQYNAIEEYEKYILDLYTDRKLYKKLAKRTIEILETVFTEERQLEAFDNFKYKVL